MDVNIMLSDDALRRLTAESIDKPWGETLRAFSEFAEPLRRYQSC
jgi:hypothetical protein